MPFIGKTPETGAFRLIDSITTSATDTYALTVLGDHYFPESARNLIVSLNGVTQAPETAYTVSGSHIVFASALTASDVIDYILVIGDAVDIGTPSDGTVGNAQLKASLDLSGKTLTFTNDQISGDYVHGGTISNFASTGIDDNATSTAITIDASGNLGVGTTNPTAYSGQTNLNINSGGVARIDFDISDSLQGYLLAESTYMGLIANTGNFLMLGANNAESMRISSAGDVQIGTAAVTGGRYFDIYNTGSTATDFAITRFITQQVGSSSTTSADIFKRKNGQFGIANNDTHDDAHINFTVGALERMRLDASGNLGVGNTNPYTRLHVKKDSDTDYTPIGFVSTEPTALITNTTSGALNYASLAFTTESNGEFGIGAVQNSGNTASDFVFVSRDSGSRAERARITSDGNLLVGTTNNLTSAELSAGETGIAFRSGNLIIASREAGAGLLVNRKTSDGDIAQFRKDGTTVGSIGTVDGDIYVGTGDTGLFFSDANNEIRPYNTSAQNSVDATINLGRSASRFKDLYLSGGAYLGGTAAANYLDDYEEGTFTAYLGFSGGDSGGLNYTNQTFAYTKVGRLVTFTGFLTWNQNNFTSSSGRMYLRGLPFTIINGGSYRGGAGIHYSNSPWQNITVYQQEFRSEDSSTDMTFNFADATDGSIDSEITTHSRIQSSGNFMVSGTYMTN